MRLFWLAALALASCAFQADPSIPADPVRSACSDVVCAASGPCRSAGTCDPATGLCSDPPAVDGTPCDDRDACTHADACLSGACGGITIECTAIDDCHLAGTCDPTTGACSAPLTPDGTRCEDGDLCTLDRCRGGACEAGLPIDCQETQCIAGVCDPISGICSGTPIPDGTPCNDQSACTEGDTCSSGACAGDPIPCIAPDRCSIAGCDVDLGCRIERLEEGDSCDDGNACTTGETCTGDACGGGTAVTCVELDGCHLAGTCDPINGCSHPLAPEGTLCDDGDLCTFNDRCTTGDCAGIQLVCTPPTQCHVAGPCNPATGYCSTTQRPDGASCNDSNQCTRTDACYAGTCIGGDPVIFAGTHCQDGICFLDVALSSGIAWTSTDSGSMIGGGGGFIDYDLDGFLDVLLGSEGGRPALYRNLGNGSFADVTLQANLPQFFLPDLFMGFTAGDYDDDGDPDLYLLAWGANILLRNEGDGTFSDVSVLAGVADSSWSTAGAFGDYDGDSDLDLYVGNYILTSSFPNHTAYPNRLYRNDGDGTFTEVAAALGVAGAGTTLGVTWTDYDGDRDPDLLVCNDFGNTVEPNKLYDNDDGSFTDVSAQSGADIEIYCMGIAPGDYDRDGDLDYYFTNIPSNVFLENRGAAGFADIAIATNTETTYDPCFTSLYSTSWGAAFHDFDQDGHLDLYVSTGYIPAASYIANAFATPKLVFRNDGNGAFIDVSQSAGVDDTRIGRGVAFGDYDNDGDVDILQINIAGSPRLFRNDAPNPGSHLVVEVIGRASARDAIGTHVVAEVGSASLLREVNRSYSYASISEKAVHFGLGTATAVDRLRIRYPSGIEQNLFEVPANTRLAVLEPNVVFEQALTGVSPPIAPPDSVVSLTFTMRNVSNTPKDVDWSVTVGGQPGPNGTVTIAARGTQPVSITVQAPSSSGTVPLFVTIDDGEGTIDQTRTSLVVP